MDVVEVVYYGPEMDATGVLRVVHHSGLLSLSMDGHLPPCLLGGRLRMDWVIRSSISWYRICACSQRPVIAPPGGQLMLALLAGASGTVHVCGSRLWHRRGYPAVGKATKEFIKTVSRSDWSLGSEVQRGNSRQDRDQFGGSLPL